MQNLFNNREKDIHFLKTDIINIFLKIGYTLVDTPTILPASMFEQTVETSDIVQKQMYRVEHPTKKLVLRPEGTMPVYFFVKEKKMDKDKCLKLVYSQKMFRHERSQRLRFREFSQVGVEIFNGFVSDYIESLYPLMNFLVSESCIDEFEFKFNTIGSHAEIKKYGEKITEVIFEHNIDVSDDVRSRIMISNSAGIKVLDSKNEKDVLARLQIDKFVRIEDYISDEQKVRFDNFLNILKITFGITPIISKHLVRGLDYYNGIVFEIIHKKENITVAAGGEYLLNGFGYAVGVERLINFKKKLALDIEIGAICIGSSSEYYFKEILPELEKSCDINLKVRFISNKSLSSALKTANKRIASGKMLCFVMFGEEEQKRKDVKFVDKYDTGFKSLNIQDIYNTILELRTKHFSDIKHE